MFNRQPFNRGKFNISSGSTIGNSGIAIMKMDIGASVNKTISANSIINLIMKENTEGTIIKYSSGSIELLSNTQGEGTKVFIVSSDISNLKMTTEGNQLLAGESIITLEGLNLRPGDELIINTLDMTITINGQNAMEYFSNDSDFFTLLNGLNTLIYNDSNSSRNISFDVIWKDRWL